MGDAAFDIVEVGPDNVDETGFFCLMSRRKADGYKRKRAWLDARFTEGLKIRMVKQGGARLHRNHSRHLCLAHD